MQQGPARCCRLVLIGFAQTLLVSSFNPECWQHSGPNMKCTDLDNKASRWRWTEGSYPTTGEVGLGGGVEVTMTRAFCIEMLRVLEWVSTCDELLVVVRQSARLWSDYHPSIFFNISHGLPKQGEVVLRAERQGKHKEGLAFASPTSQGRFEIVFNTDKCFTSLSLPQKSDAVPDVYSKYLQRCATAEKFNFEVTLAHELGHVLELGHPGARGFFLNSEAANTVSAHRFIPIVSADVCSGLKLQRQHADCHKIKDSATCQSNPACAWKGHVTRYDHREIKTQVWCANTLNDALMGAHHAWSKGFTNPSENDLAGLFFLYPSARRLETWGTNPIPLISMSSQKLQFLLQEDLGNEIASGMSVEVEGLSKRQLAELVAKQRPWHRINLPKVVETVGHSSDNSQSSYRVYLYIVAIVLFAVACSRSWTASKSYTCTLDPESWLTSDLMAEASAAWAAAESRQAQNIMQLGTMRACARCGALGHSMKLCTACRGVCYCSKECQREDWSSHKPQCQVQQATRVALDDIYRRFVQMEAERTRVLEQPELPVLLSRTKTEPLSILDKPESLVRSKSCPAFHFQ